MVIFGAGASYDSLARLPPPLPESGEIDRAGQWRPPLANQLFEPRWGQQIKQFRQAQAVIPDLEKADSDVEVVLEKFQTESQSEHPRRRIQLMAIRYYLQLMLSNCQDQWDTVTNGVTNYKALLDRIEHFVHGEKILVSFNFDTLLEDALADAVGKKIDTMQDYLNSDYKVVKLHGSINWAHQILAPSFELTKGAPLRPASSIRDLAIDRAPDLQINPSFELVPRQTLGLVPSRPLGLVRPLGLPESVAPMVPALSVPVVNKSSYECPTEQETALSDNLPNVDKVIVVGWKAAENRFLDTLATNIAKKVRFLVISSSGQHAERTATKIDERLKPQRVTADYILGQHGFSHSIVSREADAFLKS